MPEHYCFIENCRSEFPQFLIPKDKVRRKKFLEILGVTNYREGRRLCKNHFHTNDIKIGKKGTEYLVRNALPKSTSRDTAVGIPGDCTWRCMDRDLMCHRVVLAAHSQFLREMLEEDTENCNFWILAEKYSPQFNFQGYCSGQDSQELDNYLIRISIKMLRSCSDSCPVTSCRRSC